MKVLFDHNVPKRFRHLLIGHAVTITLEMGWERLANGKLLNAAALAAFEVFLSIDKKLEHEQNLNKLPIPVVILDAVSNALPQLIPFVPHVQALLEQRLQKILYLIERDGRVIRKGTGMA
ncbi:MAG TPA: hypothetical protein VFC78_23185 [Tepidisphaeraceae bacterium]|nr:hypothetical protein [Tepidisphaeraceae bacterium]